MVDTTRILGISADFHDSAAALIVDGAVVAAAEEERFSRLKHDASMPRSAIEWCLDHGNVPADGLDGVVFYEKPLTTFERILTTHSQVGPRGFKALSSALSAWSRSKLWVAPRVERLVDDLGYTMPKLSYAEHHLSHAASAFYPSPFESAVVLTFDAVGEWATSSIARGSGNRLSIEWELAFPDSLGLLYSAFTTFCGFEVNDGEYKLMGLAPYGTPRFAGVIRDRVVEIAEDGSIHLDQQWFDYRAGSRMTSRRLASLIEGPPRKPGGELTQREADIAASIQEVIEEIVLRIARHAHDLTGERLACLAGGVALNCVANAKLKSDGPFDDVWVQPAAGDAGGAIGAALWDWHEVRGQLRERTGSTASMFSTFLGPCYEQTAIENWLRSEGVPFESFADDYDLGAAVADALVDQQVVGWFQGAMEFGPRALGHRSILADPRDASMAWRLNRLVKGREGFRPFAPAVLADHAAEWFDLDRPSPYMLFTAPVLSATNPQSSSDERTFSERLSAVVSPIPACTHVDGSARVQTVDSASNERFAALLEAFHSQTGCPVLVNTSFNQAGEPIVRSPADAFRCFDAAGLDVLVLDRCLIRRVAVSEPQP